MNTQLRQVVLAVVLIVATTAPARAQGYLSPMLGLNFGGVSGCPGLRDCTNDQKNVSIAGGKFATIFGIEAELASSPTFFGEATGLSSSVLTGMGNVMLGPRAGPVRPYVLAGAGIMQAHFELSTPSVLTTHDTVLGYAIGGGVFALLGDRFGVRGDLRYFHSFREVIIQGVTLRSNKLNYSRIGGGLVIQF
ncbi:MAG: outer membrane beta-barrel protein [Acidobacteriota bacterium]|nr:outer membrane beta-barrel protein [Acidobacteriota bacterium]